MISKKFNRFALAFAAIAVACALFLGLFVHTSVPAHAQALTTNLTITYNVVEDQNWTVKRAFTQGDLAHFIIDVRNPSNFPATPTIKASVISGGGYPILSSSFNPILPGNSTSGYYWSATIPQSAPPGLYYFHATVSDSQGSVQSWSGFTVRNHISYNPFYPNYVSQCTWRAEDMMHTATGLYMPVYGNAGTWASAASAQGWSVGSNPETSSVMVMKYTDANGNPYKYWFWNGSQWVQTTTSTAGHVGWVTSIGGGGSEVYIVDRNWNLNGQDGGRWIWILGAPVNFIYSSH